MDGLTSKDKNEAPYGIEKVPSDSSGQDVFESERDWTPAEERKLVYVT